MRKQYVVFLTEANRLKLSGLISSGRSSARMLTRARILLLSDSGSSAPGRSDLEIHQALGSSISTISRIRRRFVEGGLDSALSDKESSRIYTRKLDGDKEAQMVAIACSQAPDGRKEWTMELIADRLVNLKIVDSIHPSTVHRTLKKTNLSRG